MSLKNLIVEIYFKNKNKDKKSFLAKNIEDVKSFLKPLVSKSHMKDIIDSLIEQRNDSNRFPNVIIFIDNNRYLSIDEFNNV